MNIKNFVLLYPSWLVAMTINGSCTFIQDFFFKRETLTSVNAVESIGVFDCFEDEN